MSIDVDGKRIGPGNPCFIIAEAGANHNRDFTVACQLIETAAEVGADAVKFQLYNAERHYSKKTPHFDYLAKMGIRKHIVDLLKETALPVEWLPKLKK